MPLISSPGNPASQWFQRLTGRLGIGSKISYGYGIALGVAIVGTSIGIAAGGYYQTRAVANEDEAWQEIVLLNQLQTRLLQTQMHQQQIVAVLPDPEQLQQELSLLANYATEFGQTWTEYIAAHEADRDNPELGETAGEIEIVDRWLNQDTDLFNLHFQRPEQLLRSFDLQTLSPETIATLQHQLLALNKGPVSHQIHEFSRDLAQLTQISYEEYEQAEAAEAAAKTIRQGIILGSIAVSVAIATVLATYTSRAIAQPLKGLSNIAQQVTQESNFDLQAPVTTTDEVGQLATSLNQLIQRVKQLLAEQDAAAKQQLIHQEKMASLGRMLAGVAHEINNPVNFIYGNLAHADTYIQDCFALLHTYQTETPNPSPTIQAKTAEVELDFLKEDLPKLIQSMQVGAERARQIILSLKSFSRLDNGTPHMVDVHACLDSALLILNNRIKQGITVVRNYNELPKISGFASSLYQVFANLVSNAIDALEEKNDRQTREIVITTERRDRERVTIKIADNGPGIALEHQTRIFESFFTTKAVDIGTGLGLAISREIVEDKHGGQLQFRSTLGIGTEFSIILPIENHFDRSPAEQLSASQKN